MTCQLLADYYGIKVNLSTQRRRLRDNGLKRIGNDVDVNQLRDLIRNEIREFGESQSPMTVWHSSRLVPKIHFPRHLVARD